MEEVLPKITTFDKLCRQLDIIESIFKAQYQVHDPSNPILPYPVILDKNGTDGINGRYIVSIHFFSDRELFNIQEFKAVFTDRFEKAKNYSLLEKQLPILRDKAQKSIDYYEANLTNKNKIVLDFLKSIDLPFNERLDKLKEHNACITVRHYFIGEIYFDRDRHCAPMYALNFNFNYEADNYTLALMCQMVVDFVDSFGLNIPVNKAEVLDTQFAQSNQAVQISIPEMKNNFDHVKIPDVYNHFKSGLIDHGYLSETELLVYIYAAFHKAEAPVSLFQFKDVQARQKIIKVFYEYYKTIAGKPFGKQKLYAGLLGRYFLNFDTENVSTNFSK